MAKSKTKRKAKKANQMSKSTVREVVEANQARDTENQSKHQHKGPTDAEVKAAQEETKRAMMTAAQSLVNFKVLAPFAACLVHPWEVEQAIAAGYPEIYIKANGVFYKRMQLTHGRNVTLRLDRMPAKFKDADLELQVPVIREELNFLPNGKIPFEYWQQIVEFFRQVMKKTGKDYEAHAWILWSQERGYFISIPKQTVSKASVNYVVDSESLPDGAVIVVDIHSHNTMGAFYSGTDDNNDKDKIYYSGVVGNLTDKDYKWVMRFNLHENKRQVELDDIFDTTEVVEVPGDWLDRVEVSTPTHKGGQGVGRGAVYDYSKYMKPNNAPWQYPSQQQQPGKEGAGNETSGQQAFQIPSLWESVGNAGSVEPTELASLKNEGNGGESPTSQGSRGDRKEMERLLQAIPSSKDVDGDIERLERQATEWLERRGYDKNGKEIVKSNVETEKGDDDVEFVYDSEDDVLNIGSGIEVHNDIYNETKTKHGKRAAEAYELIDVLLTDMETCDEALLDIARTCYHLMSEEGQAHLQTNGF